MKKHFCSVLAAALVTLYFGTLGTVSADTVLTAEKEYLTRAEEIGLLEDFPIDSPDRPGHAPGILRAYGQFVRFSRHNDREPDARAV